MANSPLNPIYFDNPESVDVFVKPFDGPNAEKDQVYGACPSDIGRLEDKTQVTGTDATAPKKKRAYIKPKIIVIMATLTSANVAGLAALNPVLSRPKISKENYSLVTPHELSYSFTLSTTKNYTCSLYLTFVLPEKEEEKERVELKESKSYEGVFTLNDIGEYRLYFSATNNFDYRINTLKYTVTVK